MYSVTRLLDVTEADRGRVLGTIRAAARQTGAVRHLVEPTLSGSRNGGDVLVHLRFPGKQQWLTAAERFGRDLDDAAITGSNGAEYAGTPSRLADRTEGTVYRTLLLRVAPGTEPTTVARFEDDLRLMTRYVPTISAWQLSRAEHPVGTSGWTHVFEQEFTSVDGLMGPYLMHPIHWAVVDRWFDPETTDVIVRDRVCHSFCERTTPIL
jgi:hypothetical protein